MFKLQMKSSEYKSAIDPQNQKPRMITWIVLSKQLSHDFRRTRTVASLFYSTRYYDDITDEADDGGAKGAKMQNLEAEMEAAIPVQK